MSGQEKFSAELKNSKSKINELNGLLGNLNQIGGQCKGTFDPDLSLKFVQGKQLLVNKLRLVLSLLTSLSSYIVQEKLPNFEAQQKLAGNGENISLTDNFNILLNECEEVSHLVLSCGQLLGKVKELACGVLGEQAGQNEIAELLKTTNQLIAYLISSTVVVNEQPPQILKVDTFFPITLTLLVGRYFNLFHSVLPRVEVGIVSQKQAKPWNLNEELINVGKMMNNKGTMTYDTVGRLTLSIKKLKVLTIQRAEGKKTDENVTDEVFYLYFLCHFPNGEKKIIFSLPLTAIMHGSQEANACATITWENAYRKTKGNISNLAESVSWSSFSAVLNSKFRGMVGVNLKDDQLTFLGEKVFRSTNFLPRDMLSWSQVAKERLPGCGFTFWEWFYASMKISKDYLTGLWQESLVQGFITREQAEDKLKSTGLAGTFLLRFSNSKLGEIAIDYLHCNGDIICIGPFSSKNFSTRSPANTVIDLSDLTTLYPDKEKVATFTPHIRSASPTQIRVINPYVQPVFAVQVNIPQNSLNNSLPQIQSPPSPIFNAGLENIQNNGNNGINGNLPGFGAIAQQPHGTYHDGNNWLGGYYADNLNNLPTIMEQDFGPDNLLQMNGSVWPLYAIN